MSVNFLVVFLRQCGAHSKIEHTDVPCAALPVLIKELYLSFLQAYNAYKFAWPIAT
jgi:hypothetical protein